MKTLSILATLLGLCLVVTGCAAPSIAADPPTSAVQPKSWLVTVGKDNELPQGAVPVTRDEAACTDEFIPACASKFSAVQMGYFSSVVCIELNNDRRLILMPTYKRDGNGCWQAIGDYTDMNGHPRMPLGFAEEDADLHEQKPNQSVMPWAFGADATETHIVAIYDR